MIFAAIALGCGSALIGSWIGTLAAALLNIHGTEAAFSIIGALIALSFGPWEKIFSYSDLKGACASSWHIILTCLLLCATMMLRLENLGWGEFQGDEARAMLLAEKVIGGSPDVLFSHRKGPGEILTAAGAIGAYDSNSEFAMRLPFAIAGVAALAGIAAIVTILSSSWLGILAFIIALQDGILLGFSRIVQYQMPMLLFCACGWILILVGAWKRHPSWLGLFFGAALLCHYDALFVVAPGVILCGYLALNRRRSRLPFILATFLTIALTAVFYVPFVLSSSFAETSAYLTARAASSPLPTFNFPRWFMTWSIYSGWTISLVIPAIFILGLVLSLAGGLEKCAKKDFVALVVWIIPLAIFGFVFSKPNTHFLIATPAIIVSLCLLVRRMPRRFALAAAIAVTGSLIGSVAHQQKLFFAERTGRPQLRASVVEFGFSHRTGLHAAVAFLRERKLTGSFATNDDPLVAQWYLRANRPSYIPSRLPELLPDIALFLQKPREPTSTSLPIRTKYSLIGRVFVKNERAVDIFQLNDSISEGLIPERIYN